MKSNREELQDIVEQSNIPIEWKRIFSEIFGALSNRNDLVLKDIQECVLKENQNRQLNWNDRWNIATMLISADSSGDVHGFRRLISNSRELSDDENFLGGQQYILICKEKISNFVSD